MTEQDISQQKYMRQDLQSAYAYYQKTLDMVTDKRLQVFCRSMMQKLQKSLQQLNAIQ